MSVAETAAVAMPGAVGLAGVLGLLVGSFLNVVAYRVPLGISVNRPRSFCPRCGAPVAPRDNVPVVSWMLLRGRCRSCRAAISARYPAVEASTGAVFAVLAAVAGEHLDVVGLCLLSATLIALFLVAAEGNDPPMAVALVGTVLGAGALAGVALADHATGAAGRTAAGVAAAGAAGLVSSAFAGRRSWARDAAACIPMLLPFGAWAGWLGPRPAGAGVAATVVGLAAAVWTVRRRPDLTRVVAGGTVLAGAVVSLAVGACLGVLR